ncbi:MAG: penicillin-binding protein 2 [Dysgonamonadaceae bacterium]|nr:penicillin-binding protein 2 [Dysgonamonadaceae bacterium]
MSPNLLNTEKRRNWIIIGICLIFLIYLIQLFSLQIVDNNYKKWAENNVFFKKVRYPSRGILYDRNNNLLVYNQPAYDLMVVMKEVEPFDTLTFCNILNITELQFRKRIEDIKNRSINPGYSPYLPQFVLTQLGNKEYGILQESLYKFPGFYIQNRTIREYTYSNAAHILGYIANVNKNNLAEDKYYAQNDYIGKTGVERSYETYLRGEKGIEILLRDAHGRIKGKYENGIHDTDPIPGKNLTLSIDIELQKYGEELLQNKLGSIVMIEPSTGEVLCMAASPTYDPSLFVGRQFGANFLELQEDPYRPLINRALSGQYPPGSTFKVAQGLVFLEENIITASTMYTCYNGFPPGGGKPRCHAHGSPLNLLHAIGTSCNAYFCWGLKNMLDNKKYGTIKTAMDTWKERMEAQGFGVKLGIDLPGEASGLIPDSKFYNKLYNNRWNPFTLISNAIGQGEVTTTPLQISNLAATVANRGYFYTPHVVKAIQDDALDPVYSKRRETGIQKEHYESVIEGMRLAVTSGTCWQANLPDIEVCGKTGTVQNAKIKDHSVFMGFAPKDNPKVAIVVYVENAGFGSKIAVPIGRLMLEKYLRGSIPESSLYLEQEMKNAIILNNAL